MGKLNNDYVVPRLWNIFFYHLSLLQVSLNILAATVLFFREHNYVLVPTSFNLSCVDALSSNITGNTSLPSKMEYYRCINRNTSIKAHHNFDICWVWKLWHSYNPWFVLTFQLKRISSHNVDKIYLNYSILIRTNVKIGTVLYKIIFAIPK